MKALKVGIAGDQTFKCDKSNMQISSAWGQSSTFRCLGRMAEPRVCDYGKFKPSADEVMS